MDYGLIIYAVLLSFMIALLRNLVNKAFEVKALLEALLCGCITLTLFPILEYFNLNNYLAVAIGGLIAFLDLNWFRCQLIKWIEKLIQLWHQP